MFARTVLRRMHALNVESLTENLGILVSREHEDLIKAMFPDDRVAVARER